MRFAELSRAVVAIKLLISSPGWAPRDIGYCCMPGEYDKRMNERHLASRHSLVRRNRIWLQKYACNSFLDTLFWPLSLSSRIFERHPWYLEPVPFSFEQATYFSATLYCFRFIVLCIL